MLAFTTLPKLLASRHPRSSVRIGGLGVRLPRVRTRCAVTGFSGFGGGNGGGSNGGGDDGFSDDPDFNSRDFSLFAVLTLISEKPKKLSFSEVAEVTDEEDEEEEEEEVFVKPPPQPKPLSMNYSRSASLLLLLLLLSGGIFLWRRRSRNRNASNEEEEDETAIVQRTRELQLEPSTHEPEAEGVGESSEAHEELRASSPAPDFVKELDEQDALFGTERDVKVETHTTSLDAIVIPENANTDPQTNETQVDKSTTEESVQIPAVKPQGVKTPEDQSAQQYYADLEYKDALFQDERISDKADAGERLVTVQFTPSKDDPDALVVEYLYPSIAARDLETEMSDRSRMSPTSHIDEGSTNSTLTYFNGDRTPPETFETLKKESVSDFSFDKHATYPVIEEDLGPPIKPTGIDFTKPAEWEAEGNNPKPSDPKPDDRFNTLHYLLSHADLLSQALKHMESNNDNEDTLMPEIPDEPNKTSKKKKRRKNRKKQEEKPQQPLSNMEF